MGVINLNLGQKIKQLRLENNMTIDELALAINKTVSSVKKYEGGQTGLTIDLLQDIANALDVKLASIVLDDEDDIFKLFVDRNNLHRLDKKDLSSLEIEFKFILNYLVYKYDNTK